MPKHTHILNAASNLLGISLVIIVGLHASHIARKTIADEIARVSAILFISSCILSYASLRRGPREDRLESLADTSFLIGMFSLFLSVIVLAVQWR